MGGPEGEERKLAGKVGGDGEGDWEISRRGLCWGGMRWGLRRGYGQRALQGEAAAGPWAGSPTPKEKGTISHVPASPPAEGAICPGFFGLGVSP